MDNMSHDSGESASKENHSPGFQYSLRSLLLAVLMIAIGLGIGIQFLVLCVALCGIGYFLFKRRIMPAFGILCLWTFLTCLGLGTMIQVRLDTGDLRYCYWGVPLEYEPLEPRSRQALLSLNDPQVPKSWVWCEGRVGSNNVNWMIQSFYHDAAAWVKTDPQIARLVVRDIAHYVQTTHGSQGLPDCVPMIWPHFIIDTSSHPAKVQPGWQSNPDVQAYLTAKGYP